MTLSTVEVVGLTALLDVAANEGSVFLTEDTPELLDPPHFSGNLNVPGRLGRVQDTGGEF